jgi:Tol biopolymer transport system component
MRLLAMLILAFTLVLKQQDAQSIGSAQSDPEHLFYNGSPAWSPNGELIAFVSGRAGNLDIWVMESDGSNPHNLTGGDIGPNFSPLWSPDGQFIAYISAPVGADFYDPLSGTAAYDVWVMKQDGSQPVNLTANFKGRSGEYRWSPDGNYIALISNIPLISDNVEEFNSDIWLMKPDGSHPMNLTLDHVILPGSLTWGPDSRMIAFTSGAVNPIRRDGIRILQIDNPEPIVVTTDRNDTQVAWSPNGDTLAITTLLSDGSGLYDIWRVDVDGKNLTNLTPNSPGLDWNPVWSPDGQSLAFESNRDVPDGNGRDIWVMSADGSNAVNLTGDLCDWSIRPSWSPDGTRITFEAYEDNKYTIIGFSGSSDIWVINADGSNPINITNNQ